jgi:hypothetical protein
MYYKALNINGVEYRFAVNITGSGAPTTETEGVVGMFYIDEDTDDVYKCIGENEWKKISVASDGMPSAEDMSALEDTHVQPRIEFVAYDPLNGTMMRVPMSKVDKTMQSSLNGVVSASAVVDENGKSATLPPLEVDTTLLTEQDIPSIVERVVETLPVAEEASF